MYRCYEEHTLYLLLQYYFSMYFPPKNVHGSGERLKSIESSELLSYIVYHSTSSNIPLVCFITDVSIMT